MKATMAWLLVVLLACCLQACSVGIHVKEVAVAQQLDNQLALCVYTAEDLAELEDGLHAYKVSLQYGVVGEGEEGGDFIAADRERFPFTARRIHDTEHCKTREASGFLSAWTAPLRDEISISGNRYLYDLVAKPATLEMRLYGATMALGSAESQPFSVPVEAAR